MHVAAIQSDIHWEDKAANHRHVAEMVAEADLPPETLVILPELFDTGFSFNLDRIVDDRSVPFAQQLARRHSLWIQVGYAQRGPEGRGRNRATLVAPSGEVSGHYQKVHPFSYGRESEHYVGGDRLLLRACAGAVVAPLICYDLRFPELWRLAARAGAEVFTIGANWPAARQHHWRALCIARAIENQAFVVAVNRVGRDPHLAYAGGSIIVGPGGEVLAEGNDREGVLVAALDLERLRQWREEFPALADIHRELLGTIDVDSPITKGCGEPGARLPGGSSASPR